MKKKYIQISLGEIAWILSNLSKYWKDKEMLAVMKLLASKIRSKQVIQKG